MPEYATGRHARARYRPHFSQSSARRNLSCSCRGRGRAASESRMAQHWFDHRERSAALNLLVSSAPCAGVGNVEYFHILLHTSTFTASGYNGISESNTLVISDL